jgi:2-methylcitrate dehydratase PrpD
LLLLRRDNGFEPRDVSRIEIQVPPRFLAVCNIQEPATGLQAKFSLRSTAAMALLGDDTTDIRAFTDERVTRTELRELRDRVHVHAREDLEGLTSVALVELADGRRLKASCDVCRPLGNLTRQRELLAGKFRALVEPVLGCGAAEELLERVLNLDRADSVRPLLAVSMKNRVSH